MRTEKLIVQTVDLTQQKRKAVNLKSGQSKFKLKHRGKKIEK